jgi:hypothetical protein
MPGMDEEAVRKRLMREAAEEALAEAADNDPGVAKWLDDDFAAGMTDILGMAPDKLQNALNSAIPDLSRKEIDEAIQDAKAARKALEGGWLSGPDPEKAAKILKGNDNLKGLAKSKTEKSCFIAALVLLAGFGTTAGAVIRGAVEVVSALAP